MELNIPSSNWSISANGPTADSCPCGTPKAASEKRAPKRKLSPQSAHSSSTTLVGKFLKKGLPRELISEKVENDNQPVHYVETFHIINLANEIFGYDGWSHTILNQTIDFISENNGKFSCAVSSIIKVTLYSTNSSHEDIGFALSENANSKAKAIEVARKESIDDGIKRTLRYFGNVLGNCLGDPAFLSQIMNPSLATAFHHQVITPHSTLNSVDSQLCDSSIPNSPLHLGNSLRSASYLDSAFCLNPTNDNVFELDSTDVKHANSKTSNYQSARHTFQGKFKTTPMKCKDLSLNKVETLSTGKCSKSLADLDKEARLKIISEKKKMFIEKLARKRLAFSKEIEEEVIITSGNYTTPNNISTTNSGRFGVTSTSVSVPSYSLGLNSTVPNPTTFKIKLEPL